MTDDAPPPRPPVPVELPADLGALVADSMDADPTLLPLLPALLQDLEDLGARAQDVLAAVAPASLPPGARVLDLGCGKGAAALALARHHAAGLNVHGVDAMAAFIEHARARALALGLTGRCRFETADLRDHLPGGGDHDLVMMLALGDLLGDASETVDALRTCVRVGGFMLLDDAYLEHDAGVQVSPELRACYGHRADVIARLEAHGDRVVGSHPIDGPDQGDWYQRTVALITARAAQLGQAVDADLAAALRRFADDQRAATESLGGPVTGALFLLQRLT